MSKFKHDMDTKLSGLMEGLNRMVSDESRPKFGPLDHNPCANISIARAWACANPGNMACSACRLVSYCSKECQKTDWKRHKKDCNEYIRTDEWRPCWEKESRLPSFIDSSVDNVVCPDSILSLGMSLWGNTPAIDLINLKANENDVDRNFDLAFVASGDLRHVMKTINALPAEYKGQLRILINDANPLVVSRNLALLLILGQIPDEALAADVALHFWYSVFMPPEYKLKLSAALCNYIASISKKDDNFKLGPHSSLSGHHIEDLTPFFRHMMSFQVDEVQCVQTEYSRIREHPSRRDLRDRMYSNLRPSHRLAFKEYRRFGIILPFGAINAHLNVPNWSLFSFKGRWMQTDYADPLEGWDIHDVVAAGRVHGATEEDIYGCFYFFISDHLKTLWRRLRTLKISFIMAHLEARDLARAIKSGQLLAVGISPSSGFDRIHVSNILDTIYVGLEGVLDSWSSLLSVSKTAALVGYFMNWVGTQKNGRVLDLPHAEVGPLSKRMLDEGKVKLPFDPKDDGGFKYRGYDSIPRMKRVHDDFQIGISFMMSNIDFVYDNSGPFSTFLQKQGLNSLLKKHGLKLRKNYTIVPHRIGTTIGSASSDLPQFGQKNSWYYQTSMLSNTGFERFVEFNCI